MCPPGASTASAAHPGVTRAELGRRYGGNKNAESLDDSVAAGDGDSRVWVAIDNGVYDVTDFTAQHPGGGEILRSVAGRDVSTIFQSYHPRTAKVRYSSLDPPPPCARTLIAPLSR
jgi:predicted heme/steroid binding protein